MEFYYPIFQETKESERIRLLKDIQSYYEDMGSFERNLWYKKIMSTLGPDENLEDLELKYLYPLENYAKKLLGY